MKYPLHPSISLNAVVMAVCLGFASANAVPLNDSQEQEMRKEINLELEKNVERLFRESTTRLDQVNTRENRIKIYRLDIVSESQ